MKFTKEQIADYVTGWLGANTDEYDIIAIKSMLLNSLNQLIDDQDGIEPHTKRMIELNNYVQKQNNKK